MASDRLVTAGHVLKAVMELQRRGSTTVMSEWERLEPDLIEYTLEALTTFYHNLAAAGLSNGVKRKLYRQAETIVLVSLTALRRAQRESWGGEDDDTADPGTSPTDSAPPGA